MKLHHSQSMRLQVSSLFGRFQHNISLPSSNSISIITAPNGYGKTVVLRILDSFFNHKLTFFRKLDFSTIKISLDEKRVISISKIGVDGEKSEHSNVEFRGRGFGASSKKYILSRALTSIDYRYLERHLPVELIGPDRWVTFDAEGILSTDQLVDTYSEQIPRRIREAVKIPDWLRDAIGSVTVHFVETQRLLHLDESEERRSTSRRKSLPSSVVEKDASDLSNRIGQLLQRYANESQKLDQTFPERVLMFRQGTVSGEEEIRDDLLTLTRKRDDLISVGLLGSTISEPISPSETLRQENIRRILEIYAEDTKAKLGIFDQAYEKIKLFKQILEKRFSFKRIEIDPRHGIRAIDMDTDQVIPLAELSSGEQHELVLIYDLLFTVEEDSLILIDEPELSLHVAWQKQFIADLERIQAFKTLRVLIATHSPQIIHDKWDLVHELRDSATDG